MDNSEENIHVDTSTADPCYLATFKGNKTISETVDV